MLLLLALGVFFGEADALGPGDHERSVEVQGQRRTYVVHVPKSYDGSKPFPVILVFHGGGSNARDWQRFCGLDDKAEQAGFVTVYPNGTGKKIEGVDKEVLGWNGGVHQPGGKDSSLSRVDDIGFTRTLLDDLARAVRIDHRRVFATGMSLGAIMAYRVASELSDRVAAIAPIAGSMGTESCNPKHPVSVLHFHGTDDQAVPFAGGKGKLDASGTDYLSVPFSIKAWVQADGCRETPTTEELADGADDGTRAVRKTFGGGREGAEVVVVIIDGGGHTWPGREFGPELKVLGKSSRDISANDMMWEFFQKHPMSLGKTD
jgi:polyhydroxybutyrate depolymerase